MTSVIKGDNNFCGPAVISALAGISTNEAANRIQKLRGNTYDIRGVYLNELKLVLEALGFRVNELNNVKGSLFHCLVSMMKDYKGRFIFFLPRHFVVIEINEKNQIFFVDNHTVKPIGAFASARMGQRVSHILQVSK